MAFGENHTTDKCYTFKKFLLLHKDRDWYDLSRIEEIAIGCGKLRVPNLNVRDERRNNQSCREPRRVEESPDKAKMSKGRGLLFHSPNKDAKRVSVKGKVVIGGRPKRPIPVTRTVTR